MRGRQDASLHAREYGTVLFIKQSRFYKVSMEIRTVPFILLTTGYAVTKISIPMLAGRILFR